MKKLLIILLICCASLSKAQMTTDGYRAHTGELKHNIAGQAIGMGAGWLVYKKTNSMALGMLTSIASALVAGVVKEEIMDRGMHMGTPSTNDKIATVWGGAVGAICLVPLMVRHRDRLYEREELFGNINTNIFVHPSDSCYTEIPPTKCEE